MQLFKVLLIFSVTNEANRAKIIMEETWYDIVANSEMEAREYANKIGQNENEFFVNRYGENIQWKFEDIRLLIPVVINNNISLIQPN